MSDIRIVPVTDTTVPTILSLDPMTREPIIGFPARQCGLQGQTTVFNFKPDIGKGDKEFSEMKKYGYYLPATDLHDKYIEVITAKQAVKTFIEELLGDTYIPSTMVIGEPALRETAWKENFRKHMREVFRELEFENVKFFPEPFAVFQYYRLFEAIFPATGQAETILVVDMGGGTFSSCVIRTTEEGRLARGGALAVPLGLHAELCGGSEVDREFLKVIVSNAQQKGIQWVEDAVKRADFTNIKVLLYVEDVKIALSERIGPDAPINGDYAEIKEKVVFPEGSLHPDREVSVEVSGEDLKKVVRMMWRKRYGEVLAATLNEAEENLKKSNIKLENLDRVLVAGGSSALPFTKEEIAIVLRNKVRRSEIYLGADRGKAVAYGIACQCREESRRDMSLTVGKIAPCLLNDLYLGFRKNRRSTMEPPKTRSAFGESTKGKLLSSPFQTNDAVMNIDLTLPFEVKGRLFYNFSTQPFEPGVASGPGVLNLSDDVASVPSANKISRKARLLLEFDKKGTIKPTFFFQEKGQGAKRGEIPVNCPEVFLNEFSMVEGQTYTGVDFGNSNSYVVRMLYPEQERIPSVMPDFFVPAPLLNRLRGLEEVIEELRNRQCLKRDVLVRDAKHQGLLFVFHSNKIEQNPLTKGETVEAFRKAGGDAEAELTLDEREAVNLERAYKWMLNNLDSISREPENFIRNLNKIILKDVKDGGGEYRRGTLRISQMEHMPPEPGSVRPYMAELGKEIATGPVNRSAIEFACTVHTKMVWIHPFVDGNGRTARLMLNGLLLANDLPVVVVNYDDRERYLNSLIECNEGNLGPLLDLILESFEIRLQKVAGMEEEGDTEEKEPRQDKTDKRAAAKSPVKLAMAELRTVEAPSPLAEVMRAKIVEKNERDEATYEAWRRTYGLFLAEVDRAVKEFNSMYGSQDFWARITQFDIVSFEKFSDISRNKKASRTWYFGMELWSGSRRERMVFFFWRGSERMLKLENASRVTLWISRDDGSGYKRLETEPINLREIGYASGQLFFRFGDDSVKTGNTPKIIEQFLADVIRSYL